MKKGYRLTQHQKERYYGLLKNSRSIAKELANKRIRAGQNEKMRELPDSVIPRKMTPRRVFESRQDFKQTMEGLKKFKNSGYYYKTTYKREILDNMKNKIEDTAIAIGDAVESFQPEGDFGRYADYQIEESPELAGYMEMYNRLNGMPIDKFMDMYFRGFIVPYKYIYRELDVVGKSENAGNAYLEEQEENIRVYQESKRR